MTTLARSSGDLLADRRFGYAKDLMEGDPAAAVDLLLQTIDRVPDWVPIWMALGSGYENQGQLGEAETAFARAESLDPTGLFGAGLHLARLRGDGAGFAMPRCYVAALFDDYAARFDKHLTEGLGYCGPALIARALVDAVGPRRYPRAVDLGCGTGLMGAAVRPIVDRLTGVDLSAAMVAEAASTGLYDQLQVGEIGRFLEGLDDASCDLILAADVFVYVGALDELVQAAARAMAPAGLLAFTLQESASEPIRLGSDLRFAHSAGYIDDLLRRSGFMNIALTRPSIRREAGIDVPGLVVTARKP